MAIAVEFIHLFIPMLLIDEEYPGGWPAWKKRYARVIGRSAWFDEHLYTQGAMNGMDIDSCADDWKRSFSQLFTTPEAHAERWNTAVGKYMYPDSAYIEWFKIGGHSAWLIGDEDSKRISRHNFMETDRWNHPNNYPARMPAP